MTSSTIQIFPLFVQIPQSLEALFAKVLSLLSSSVVWNIFWNIVCKN
jgi:hypothetical protein